MTQNSTTIIAAIVFVGSVSLAARPSPDTTNKDKHGVFTGDVKIVFYVRDVRSSVQYYSESLGFKFHHYYDSTSGESVAQWTRDKPPFYAEMSYAGRRFGIHSPTSKADKRSVGAAKIYFRVNNLDDHHDRTVAWGANPSEIKKRSWMDMFHVVDPDGNRIYFAYTDDDVHGNPWFKP